METTNECWNKLLLLLLLLLLHLRPLWWSFKRDCCSARILVRFWRLPAVSRKENSPIKKERFWFEKRSKKHFISSDKNLSLKFLKLLFEDKWSYEGAPSAIDGSTGPGWQQAVLCTTINVVSHAKWGIFPPPSNDLLMDDGVPLFQNAPGLHRDQNLFPRRQPL